MIFGIEKAAQEMIEEDVAITAVRPYRKQTKRTTPKHKVEKMDLSPENS